MCYAPEAYGVFGIAVFQINIFEAHCAKVFVFVIHTRPMNIFLVLGGVRDESCCVIDGPFRKIRAQMQRDFLVVHPFEHQWSIFQLKRSDGKGHV